MAAAPKPVREDPASIVGGDPLVLSEQSARLRAESQASIERCKSIFRRIDEVIAQSEHIIAEIRASKKRPGSK